MQTQNEANQPERAGVTREMQRSRRSARWIATVLATLTLFAAWGFASTHPYVDADSTHYQAMADGKPAMKPFAFRALEPAIARLYARVTGKPTTDGFLIVGLLSGWALLYGVLRPVMERGQDTWIAVVLILMPFARL